MGNRIFRKKLFANIDRFLAQILYNFWTPSLALIMGQKLHNSWSRTEPRLAFIHLLASIGPVLTRSSELSISYYKLNVSNFLIAHFVKELLQNSLNEKVNK